MNMHKNAKWLFRKHTSSWTGDGDGDSDGDGDGFWKFYSNFKETIHMRLHPNSINRDSGIEIPEAWMPTIKKSTKKARVISEL